LTPVRGRRRGQTLALVLMLLALTLMTLDLRARGDGAVNRARQGALMVFAPAQQMIATMVRPVHTASTWLDDQQRLHAELVQLRSAVARLDAADAERDDLRSENARLRRLLGMRERLGHRSIGARVLGRPPGDPGSSVVIDAGTGAGLVPGMAVTEEHGLVGRVIAATATHARVELVSSPSARYAVRVNDGGQPGRLRGRGDVLQLELNDPHVEIAAGAAVVTRAYEGSTVPDGLPVGSVVPGGQADRYSSIRPYVDVTALDLVQVIVDAPRQPQQVDPSDGAAAPLPAPARPGER